MKFKDFLQEQESQSPRDWFEQFHVFADGHSQDVGLLYNAKGVLSYADVDLETKLEKATFDPPMESDWWQNINGTLTFNGVGSSKITFPNFKKFPDVKNVLMSGCVIQSLEGIENCKNLEKFNLGHEIDFNCGLLRLMKLPKKCKIELHASWAPEDSKPISPELEKALKIIMDYRRDNNVVDCIDELIAEGLKEYAKL